VAGDKRQGGKEAGRFARKAELGTAKGAGCCLTQSPSFRAVFFVAKDPRDVFRVSRPTVPRLRAKRRKEEMAAKCKERRPRADLLQNEKPRERKDGKARRACSSLVTRHLSLLYSPGGATGAGSWGPWRPAMAAMIWRPWKRPFSMKISPVWRPPTRTPAT
jgi:hypothetical protein